MLLKSLGLAGIAVIAGVALAMPAKAERDINAYSAVKTNFTVGAWSYKADPKFKRKEVDYSTGEKPGTIIIETGKRYLYLVLSDGKALRYGIGVGRSGFTWKGAEHISRKAEWPAWHPPAEMIERQPELPEFMEGGPNNPLGARSWGKLGISCKAQPGAVMVFWRESKQSGKGHVGFYVAEDDMAFHILGGNQSDAVNVKRVPKDRFVEARWPATAPAPTGGPRKADASGKLSEKES